MDFPLPELGVGIVYVPRLEPILEPTSTCIDFLEIEPQTLWQFHSGRKTSHFLPDYTLRHLRALPQRKLIHSVGNGLGGTYQPDTTFISALIDTIQALDAPWASEHLSVTQFKDRQKVYHTGFMLPPLQTYAGVKVAAETIRNFSRQLPVPLAIETGVNYLQPRSGELSDGEFVAATVEAADCGILLDLHNIWTNQQNGRQPVKEFLACLPLDRVWEVHLGGGFEHEGYWLDAHSGAVPEAVLSLTEQILPLLPNIKAITYEIFSSYIPLFGLDAIHSQLQKIQSLWQKRHSDRQKYHFKQTLHQSEMTPRQDIDNSLEPDEWETTLGELVTNGNISGRLADKLSEDPGIKLMQKLIWKFRAGAIVKNIGTLTRLIMIHSNSTTLEQFLDEYIKKTKPQTYASDECNGFLTFLVKKAPAIPYLQDILRYEQATIEAQLSQEPQLIQFSYDPRTLLEGILNGSLPDNIEQGSYELEIPPVSMAMDGPSQVGMS
jgi:uncharacterized protein (UPF0276 family)